VRAYPADLYIAHHATLLPIAAQAAQEVGAYLGYDAEDFYSGMWPLSERPSPIDELIRDIERRWLAACDYITAAAPMIAEEYVRTYGIDLPKTVLNTFPRGDRPASFRRGDPSQPLRLYWYSQCIGANRGLEDAVHALGRLSEFQIELHLRGDWQAGYRQRLFELARKCGVADRIIEHPPDPPNSMAREASDYDVGLASEPFFSRNSSLCISNKIFTYLLAGLAILATRTPAQAEFLSGVGSAAVLYDSSDVSMLTAKLAEWYLDRKALEFARWTAWDWGDRRFNWDVEQEAFLHIVSAAMGDRVESAV
jgi:glycosyltransferase involved in cell wall biosynthesis